MLRRNLVDFVDMLESVRKDKAKRDEYEKKVREKCNDLSRMVLDAAPYAAVARPIRKQPMRYGIKPEDMAIYELVRQRIQNGLNI